MTPVLHAHLPTVLALAAAGGLAGCAHATPAAAGLAAESSNPPSASSTSSDALSRPDWKQAAFFDAVKRHVKDHWSPERIYASRDPIGSVYGLKPRLTILRVQLQKDGSVAELTLEKSSGVDFLDQLALQAFKEAEPFSTPPPPRALLDETGRAHFRFGFQFVPQSEASYRDLSLKPVESPFPAPVQGPAPTKGVHLTEPLRVPSDPTPSRRLGPYVPATVAGRAPHSVGRYRAGVAGRHLPSLRAQRAPTLLRRAGAVHGRAPKLDGGLNS